jgi:hypothetical protein
LITPRLSKNIINHVAQASLADIEDGNVVEITTPAAGGRVRIVECHIKAVTLSS